MSVTYKFTCKADPTKDFEMSVDESLNMVEYIDSLTKTGFIVHGPVDKIYLFEPKRMPDRMDCDACGHGQLRFISIELGYSCNNDHCVLHFRNAEQVYVD